MVLVYMATLGLMCTDFGLLAGACGQTSGDGCGSWSVSPRWQVIHVAAHLLSVGPAHSTTRERSKHLWVSPGWLVVHGPQCTRVVSWPMPNSLWGRHVAKGSTQDCRSKSPCMLHVYVQVLIEHSCLPGGSAVACLDIMQIAVLHYYTGVTA